MIIVGGIQNYMFLNTASSRHIMWQQLQGTLKSRSFDAAELCRYSTGLFLDYL